MKKEFDTLVFIGRMNPPHLGHIEVIKKALSMAEQVIIILGSIDQPPSLRNPLSYITRMNLLKSIFQRDFNNKNLYITGVRDHVYCENRWMVEIQKAVEVPIDDNTGLIGHTKDETSYYLKAFPQWRLVEVDNVGEINATDIRNTLFEELKVDVSKLPRIVSEFLLQYIDTNKFKLLKKEYDFVKKYKEQFKSYPYDPTFNTVDSIVVQSGHILLVERSSYPGKGLYALPGGFINTEEKIVDSMIRELVEETKIKVPEKVLRGSIIKNRTFDDPNRSSRGRTITEGFLINLNNEEKLPKVKGSSDAKKAFWMPLGQLHPSVFFEDHYQIIEVMVGL